MNISNLLEALTLQTTNLHVSIEKSDLELESWLLALMDDYAPPHLELLKTETETNYDFKAAINLFNFSQMKGCKNAYLVSKFDQYYGLFRSKSQNHGTVVEIFDPCFKEKNWDLIEAIREYFGSGVRLILPQSLLQLREGFTCDQSDGLIYINQYLNLRKKYHNQIPGRQIINYFYSRPDIIENAIKISNENVKLTNKISFEEETNINTNDDAMEQAQKLANLGGVKNLEKAIELLKTYELEPAKSTKPKIPSHTVGLPSTVKSGMVNPGNNCFANSMLQVLRHVNELKTWAMHTTDPEIKKILASPDDGCVIGPISTNTLKKHIADYITDSQQDPHEFLKGIDETIKDTEISYPTAGSYKNINEKTGTSELEKFSELNLAIVENCYTTNDKNTVSELLKKYFEPEIRSVNYESVKFSKKMYKYPNILVIRLNRDCREEGMTTTVKRKDKIYADNFDSTSMNNMYPGQYYDLIAYIVHVGESTNRGHYFAIIREGENWYKYDDSTVTNMGEHTDTSLYDTYMLFYERKQLE